MTDSSDSEEPVPRVKSNPGKWGKNVMKQKRLAGKPYANSVGKLIPGRQICADCNRKCLAQIDDKTKEILLNQFNVMATKNIQDTYLSGLISSIPPMRKRNRLEEPLKSHSAVYHYRVKLANSELVVCKTAFLSLHGISPARVRRIITLISQGVMSPVDKRGGKRETWCKADNLKQQIGEHIMSFPFRVAHYGKSGKKTRYLNSDLNCKIIYNMYLLKYEPEAYMLRNSPNDFKPVIKYEYFLKYYKENFNYPFGRPRTDICSMCEKLKLDIQCEKVGAKRDKLKAELKLHKKKAQKFYDDLKECQALVKQKTDNPDSECIVFDYMQNLPYPHIPITEMFYSRQIWLYVFGFHRLSDDQGFMYPYTELTAKKTPNETVSLLEHFIANHVAESVKNLYIFTDACTAQNRNNTIVKFLHHLVIKKRFSYIRHIYPTRGHSYLPCDRDFGRIEIMKRKQDTVYSAQQWVKIIEKSASNIHIETVDQSMIMDYKSFFAKMKQPVPLTKDEEGWKVTSYKILEYRGNSITASKTSSGLVTQTFQFRQKIPNLEPLKKAYDKEIPLKLQKAKDISKYLTSIDPEYRPYFQNLLEKYGNTVDSKVDSGSEIWDSE